MPSIISRSATAVIVFATLLTLGCRSDTPTAPIGTDSPSSARFEGGIGYGSGNFVGTGSNNTTTAADSGSTAVGGIGFGSGH